MATVDKWSGREARALREALRMSVRGFAAHLGVNERTITKWEGGGAAAHPRPELQAALDTALGRADDEVRVRFDAALGARRPVLDRRTVLCGAAATAALGVGDVELLRRELADALDHAAMSEASLDDWEQTVHQYGLAFRYRPAAALLADLATDLAELYRLLERRRAILVPTRLSHVMARLSGLMCATLLRLDQHTAARNWARTAKAFADEAGDGRLHAWVLSQEGYSHYYNNNLGQALHVATLAQHVADREPCTGVAQATALEMRTHALFGRVDEAQAALGRLERALAGMDAAAGPPSLFAYSEAKFHFHTGNAYTHLGMTAPAIAAQEQALTLYPENDYFDRPMITLDRADCLIRDDELAAATDAITQALQAGDTGQRNPVIDQRARQVLGHLPARAVKLPAVRELREVLASP